MSKNSANIYQNSRNNAGFTQVVAAEFLNVSERTLASYEAGQVPVPDDVAKVMVKLYRDDFLGYQHLQLHEIAKEHLPEVEIIQLGLAALQLMSISEQYIQVQSKMIDVCKDGKITDDEKDKWAEVEAIVRELIKASFTFLYADKIGKGR